MRIFDLETLSLPPEEVLKNLPFWDEDEARERVPKTYKKEEAISGWLEQDKASWGKDLLEKAALNPETATIAVVGICDGRNVTQFDATGSTEKHMIETLLEMLKEDRWMGWNIHGFDLPFLIRRAWINGISVPRVVFDPRSRYPIPERFTDCMKVWQCGNSKAPFTSLDRALRSVGLPGKPDGKEFAKLWAEDPDEGLEYNAQELLGQAELYKRMGLQ